MQGLYTVPIHTKIDEKIITAKIIVNLEGCFNKKN